MRLWNVKQGRADFLFRAKRAHWTISGLKSGPKWSALHVWAGNPPSRFERGSFQLVDCLVFSATSFLCLRDGSCFR